MKIIAELWVQTAIKLNQVFLQSGKELPPPNPEHSCANVIVTQKDIASLAVLQMSWKTSKPQLPKEENVWTW